MELKRCPQCRSSFRGDFARCPRDGTALEVQFVDPMLGTLLGKRYLVRTFIGEGGAGLVYEAVDQRLDRAYAIKVLLGDLGVFPEVMERFRREARVAARMDHPNVSAVVDYGFDVDNEPPYLVMELARGQPLCDVVDRDGPFDEPRARRVLAGIAAGLQHAHEQGVLHRDLKPSNVILDRDGERPRLVDFGVAQVQQATSRPRLTKQGTVIGTPGFIAPEVLRGAVSRPTSDLYGLGVTAWYVLKGRMPSGGTDEELVLQTLEGLDLSPLDDCAVSPGFRDAIKCLLAPDPADRPASAEAFQQLLEGAPPPLPHLRSPAPAAQDASDPTAQSRSAATREVPMSGESADRPAALETPADADPARDPGDATPGSPEPHDAVAIDVEIEVDVPDLIEASGRPVRIGSNEPNALDAGDPTMAPPEYGVGRRGWLVLALLLIAGAIMVFLTQGEPTQETKVARVGAGGGPAAARRDAAVRVAAPPRAEPVERANSDLGRAAEREPPAEANATATKSATPAPRAPPPAKRRRRTPPSPPPVISAEPPRTTQPEKAASTTEAPISASALTAAYSAVGTRLDALEAEQGKAAMASLRRRYFDIPLADALRRPDRIETVMKRIRALERDVDRATSAP